MNCTNGICYGTTSSTTATLYGVQTMSCEPSYAWNGLNVLLFAIAAAVLIGVGIAFFYSLQEWLDSASKRRAEFINSIKGETTAPRRR